MVVLRIIAFILFSVFASCHGFCEKGTEVADDEKTYCFHTEPLNFYLANMECETDDSHLVSIENLEENGYLQKNINNLATEGIHFWIGLTSVYQPVDSFRWTDNSNFKFSKLPKVRISETGNTEGRCALMKQHADGNWFYDNCATPQAFICEKVLQTPTLAPPPVQGYCPKGYFGLGNKCYKVVTTKDNNGYGVRFPNARIECQKAADEGYLKPDLASISNAEENAEVTSLLYREEGNFWIGLEYTDGKWGWLDGSAIWYTNWDKEPASGHTAAAIHGFDYHGGKWISQPDDFVTLHGFVCQIEKDPNNVVNTPDPSPCQDCPDYCPEGYTSYWKGCYKVFNILSTWEKALEHCQGESADLVTIQTEIENDAVFMFFQTVPTEGTEIWMGMRDKEGTGDYSWENSWPVVYTKWDVWEPSHQGRCAAMGLKGEWITAECNFEKPFMCKYTHEPPMIPIPGDGEICPSPKWKEIQGSCFYFYPRMVNWNTAMATCKQLHPEATLAYIRSAVENKLVAAELRNYQENPADFYIGLYKESGLDEFKWYDRPDVPVSYVNWNNDIPIRSDYVIMRREETTKYGTWSTHSAVQISNALCRVEKIKEYVMPDEVQGSCPGSDWISYGDECLLFDPENAKTWEAARDECKVQGEQSMLVTFSDFNKHRFVWSKMNELLVGETETADFWIGLRRDTMDSSFYWVDSTESVNFTTWGPDQPDTALSHFCGVINMEESQWFDEICSEVKPFVCQHPKTIDGSGLSGGQVAGIVIGVLVSVALIAVVAGFLYQRKGGKMPNLPSIPTPGFSLNRFDESVRSTGGLPNQENSTTQA